MDPNAPEVLDLTDTQRETNGETNGSDVLDLTETETETPLVTDRDVMDLTLLPGSQGSPAVNSETNDAPVTTITTDASLEASVSALAEAAAIDITTPGEAASDAT
jgi:hypothetical protein